MKFKVGQEINYHGRKVRVAMLHPGYHHNPENYFPLSGEGHAAELHPKDLVEIQAWNVSKGQWGWSTTGVEAGDLV